MKIDMKDFNGICECGRNHQLDVKDIFLEEGAIERFPEIMKQEPYNQYHHFVMVCDENTYEAAGKEVEKQFEDIRAIILSPVNLHGNETGVAMVDEQLAQIERVDCMIAVGSGTIHDLTRYCAFQRSLPFISVPTAASVDGFVSTVAAMSWYGFKKSLIAESPVLVVCDSRVIAKAPMRLTASGAGDLLGKYTALADWKITNILDGEYICDRIVDMEYDALKKLKEALPGIKKGETRAYEELMYGLLLSGLAMQMTGHSRPASGAEHHMAHFWEMHVINEDVDFLHGEKVGVGLALVSDIYHDALPYLKKRQFTVRPAVPVETDLIESVFTDPQLCENIKKTNDPNILDDIDADILKEKTGEIINIIETIPTSDEIIGTLKTLGGVATLDDLGFAPDMKKRTAQAAPYIRERITYLRILKFYDFYESVIG